MQGSWGWHGADLEKQWAPWFAHRRIAQLLWPCLHTHLHNPSFCGRAYTPTCTVPASLAMFTHTPAQCQEPRARSVCHVGTRAPPTSPEPTLVRAHGGTGERLTCGSPAQPTTTTSCGSRSRCGMAWCWSPSASSTTWPSATTSFTCGPRSIRR